MVHITIPAGFCNADEDVLVAGEATGRRGGAYGS